MDIKYYQSLVSELRSEIAMYKCRNAELEREVRNLRKQVSDYGWQTNPDRMGR